MTLMCSFSSIPDRVFFIKLGRKRPKKAEKGFLKVGKALKKEKNMALIQSLTLNNLKRSKKIEKDRKRSKKVEKDRKRSKKIEKDQKRSKKIEKDQKRRGLSD
jgi:hypothetical protein